jgi:hypothetical protein
VIHDRIALELGAGTAFAEESSGYNWGRLVKKWWRLKKYQRQRIFTGDILPLFRQRGKVQPLTKVTPKQAQNAALRFEKTDAPTEDDILRRLQQQLKSGELTESQCVRRARFCRVEWKKPLY